MSRLSHHLQTTPSRTHVPGGEERCVEAEILTFPVSRAYEQDSREADLLLELPTGGAAAAEAVWDAFAPKLLTLCYRILQDRQEAEDVLQLAMTRIWEKADQFNPSKGKAGVWVGMITRGLALDALRRRGLRQRVLQNSQLGAELHLPQDERESTEWIDSVLAKLSEGDANVVREIVLQGKTAVELAQEAGQPEVTVRSRLRRALARLREIVIKEESYGKRS